MQALPYNQDWAVQTDANLPPLSLSNNQFLAGGLTLTNQDNLGHGALVSLFAERDGNGTFERGFEADIDNGNRTYRNDVELNATQAAVRFRWKAAEAKLYFEYDPNGAAEGLRGIHLIARR